MRCSSRKVRNISPDPTSSTKHSATSATTTPFLNLRPALRPARTAAAAKGGDGVRAERAPRGHHPEEHGDGQRNRRGESEDGRVDPDGVEPRKIRRGDRAQLASANPGQRDAGARAEASEHERVGQHLTHGTPASGAERGAHRQLPLARPRANQQQVRDVRAGDQEEKRGRAGQREDRWPDLFNQRVVHRLQPRVEARGGLQRKVLPNLRRDRFHLFLRTGQRHPWLEPADRPQTERVAVRVVVAQAIRHPAVRTLLDVGAGREHQLQSRREHADDLGTRTAGHALAQHLRIAAVASQPVRVAENRHGRRRRLSIGLRGSRGQRLRQAVGVQEVAADRDWRAHQPEKVRRHQRQPDLFRRAVRSGQNLTDGAHGSHVLEHTRRAVADVGVVLVRERHPEGVARPQVHVHDDESIRIRIWQRAQQDRVRDAEDRRARADPERDGQHRGDREHRASAQRADGEREIVQQHGTPYFGPRSRFNLSCP